MLKARLVQYIEKGLQFELVLPGRRILGRHGTMNHYVNLGLQLWRDDSHSDIMYDGMMDAFSRAIKRLETEDITNA